MPEDSLYSAFQKVVDLAPDNAQARLQLVLSHWDKQEYDKVIGLCLPAQEYNPDEMVFYYFAGLAYYQKRIGQHLNHIQERCGANQQ